MDQLIAYICVFCQSYSFFFLKVNFSSLMPANISQNIVLKTDSFQLMISAVMKIHCQRNNMSSSSQLLLS